MRTSRVILFIGVAVTILSHFVEKAERYSWATDIFAPGYTRAHQAYEQMLASAGRSKSPPVSLGPENSGFSEILSILASEFSMFEKSNVAKLRIKDFGIAAGASVGDTVKPLSTIQPHFELTLRDGKILTKYTNDLRPEIRKRFLEDPLSHWGIGLFWTGIAITVVSGFLRKK